MITHAWFDIDNMHTGIVMLVESDLWAQNCTFKIRNCLDNMNKYNLFH